MDNLEIYKLKLKHYIRIGNQLLAPKHSEVVAQDGFEHESYGFDDDILSKPEQDNIYGLRLFMNNYPNLTDAQITKIINSFPKDFKILQILLQEDYKFVARLRANGFYHTCPLIIQDRKNREAYHANDCFNF